MSRRGHRMAQASVGLDSLVDIVMNVMGALFFMVVYISLSAHGLRGKITTPLATPGTTEPVFFECRESKVFKPDIESLAEGATAALRQCVGADLSRIPDCQRVLDRKPLQNAFYRGKPVALQCPGVSAPVAAVTFEALTGIPGETVVQIQEADSEFQRELRRLDRSKWHPVFIVRSDSFATFHSARRVANKLGFKAGWLPFESAKPLRTGCPGQSGPGPKMTDPQQ